MNPDRRKKIDEAAELIGQAKTLLEIARDEERDAFENLPEGIQQSEKGERIEQAAEKLDEIVDAIDTLEGDLSEANGEPA